MKKFMLCSMMILGMLASISCGKMGAGNLSRNTMTSTEKNPLINRTPIATVLPSEEPAKKQSPSVEKNTSGNMGSDAVLPPSAEPIKTRISSTETKGLQIVDKSAIGKVKDALGKGKDFSFFDKFKTGSVLKIKDL